MEGILLLASVLLSALFVLAGITKLKDRAGFRQTLAEFGLPLSLASPISVFLPLAELGVGLALIPVATAWWGAMGALALLLVFTVGIGINLAQGRKPDCDCFGQLHSSPIEASTLVRNGLLAGLAGFVVLAGWASLTANRRI